MGTPRCGWAVVLFGLWAACERSGRDAPTPPPEPPPRPGLTLPPPLQRGAPVGTIGGTFAVTDDGAATYTVALDVPAGRAGMQPSLSLRYASRGDNGLVGVGWSLDGFSQIARCGSTSFRDGVVRPVQYRGADRFCFDGARLLEIASGPAVVTPLCAAAVRREYRTEPDTFARVIACGEDVAGPLEWIVYAKDGRISRFGTDGATRAQTYVRTPTLNGDAGPVALRRFAWLIAHVADRAGNDMTFTYGRATGSQQLEWWPTRIDYGGHAGAGHAANRAVVFKYGVNADDEPGPRVDAWSGYAAGAELTHTRVLKSITMIAPAAPEQVPAPPHVRKYVLTYERGPATGRLLLRSMAMCDGLGVCLKPTTFAYAQAAPTFTAEDFGPASAPSIVKSLYATDVTGDGRDDLVYRTVTSGIARDHVRVAGGTMGAPSFADATEVTPRLDAAWPAPVPYDTSGDGTIDLVTSGCNRYDATCDDATGECERTCTEQGTILYSSRGDGTFRKQVQDCDPARQTCGGSETVADVNGDGRSDVLSGMQVLLSLHSAVRTWQKLVHPITRPAALTEGSQRRHLDVDGDGLIDLLVPYAHNGANRYDALHVRGTGAAFTVEATPTNLPAPKGNCGVFADVNGDGLVDAVDVSAGAYVSLNRGDGRFEARGNWGGAFEGTPLCKEQVMAGTFHSGWKQTAVFPVDYNGDGFQDLLVLQPTATFAANARVLVSSGAAFQLVQVPRIPLACASAAAAPDATTLDGNGDGLFDVAFICWNAATSSGTVRVYTQGSGPLAAAGRGEVLTEIKDGLGAVVRRVDYRLMTEAAVYARPAGPSPFTQALLAVSAEHVDRGDGRLVEIARHVYEGATFGDHAEGWLGFRRHTITDPRTGATRRVTYAADTLPQAVGAYLGGKRFHPLAGVAVEELEWVRAGSRVRATRTTRAPVAVPVVYPSGAGNFFAFVGKQTVESFETGATAFTADAPGTPLTRTITDTRVDMCGAPIEVTVDRAPGMTPPVRTTTKRTFAPANEAADIAGTRRHCDLGAGWLAFLELEAITSQEGGGTALVATQYVAEPDGSGRVRDTIRQPAIADQKLCTRVVQRDRFGSPTVVDVTPRTCNRATAVAPHLRTRTTATGYDADGIHVTSTTNAALHTATRKVVPGLGVAYSETDANGLETVTERDGFGRALVVHAPDGRGVLPSTITTTTTYAAADARCTGGGYTAAQFALVESTRGSDGRETLVCRDRLGRARRLARKTLFGALTYVDTVYDGDGAAPHDRHPERVYSVTRPHANGAPAAAATRKSYDNAGRVTIDCHARPDDPAQEVCDVYAYTGLAVEVCEAWRVRRRKVWHPYGPLASSSIYPGDRRCGGGAEVRTTYAYGPDDQLVKVTDAAGNVVRQDHDGLGRRERLTDPDLGKLENTYSAFGEILTSVDGNGVTTTFTYDALGRPLTRTAPDGTDTFAWDPPGARGRLRQSTRGTVVRTFAYDALVRPSTSTLVVDGVTYESRTTYDAQGRVETGETPTIAGLGRVTTRHGYGANGELARLELRGREMWRATAADAEGRVTGETFGNGVRTTRTFRGRYLDTIVTDGGPRAAEAPGGWQHVAYDYLDNGSLAARRDVLRGATETFDYDGADRLTFAQVAGQPAHTWQYDGLGNMTSASDVAIAGCTGLTMKYDKANAVQSMGPHAVSTATCGTSTWAMRYDANGNATSGLDGADAFTWTSFNKLASSTNVHGTWQMLHDADHQRVKRRRSAGTSPGLPWTSIVQAGALEHRTGGGRQQWVLRVPAGSAVVELSWDWDGARGAETLRYLHGDQLGSPELVMDGAGALVERRSFDAWGNPRGADMTGAAATPGATTTTFTGHREDLGVTIGDGRHFVDMGGRIYSPLFKRFWSPDPFVQAPAYGPSWNRYAYVFGNPLRFTDPTGYRTWDQRQQDWGASLAVFGTMFQAPGLNNTTNNEYLAGRLWEGDMAAMAAAIRKTQWESQQVMFRGADGKNYVVERRHLGQAMRDHGVSVALIQGGAVANDARAQGNWLQRAVIDTLIMPHLMSIVAANDRRAQAMAHDAFLAGHVPVETRGHFLYGDENPYQPGGDLASQLSVFVHAATGWQGAGWTASDTLIVGHGDAAGVVVSYTLPLLAKVLWPGKAHLDFHLSPEQVRTITGPLTGRIGALVCDIGQTDYLSRLYTQYPGSTMTGFTRLVHTTRAWFNGQLDLNWSHDGAEITYQPR